LARLWRDERLDVVHAHWWIPAGVSAWLAGRPYVVTLHGTDVALLERSRAARLVGRRVLHGAAAVTAVSSYLAVRAARAVQLQPGRILVQPMPIDTQGFSRTSRGGGGIVTVGRLTSQKRIDLLLDALAELRTRGRTPALTIVGNGPARPGLDRRVAELRIAGQVRFLGEVPPERIPDAVGDADVFVFPAVGEGLGLVAAEAVRKWLWWALQLAVASVVARMVWGAIVKNWGEFRSLHVSLAPRPGWIALSALVVFLTYAIQVESWRRVLAGWAQHLSYGRAARIWLVVNLGRYIPGKDGSVAGLVVLDQRAGVETWAAGASALAMQALGIGTAAALVAAATPGAASPLRLAAAALVSIATIGFLAWDRAARTVARLVGNVAQFRPLPLAAVAESAGL